jgi:hypothetical protein
VEPFGEPRFEEVRVVLGQVLQELAGAPSAVVGHFVHAHLLDGSPPGRAPRFGEPRAVCLAYG